MVVLSLHVFVLAIILLAMLQAGCAANRTSQSASASSAARGRMSIDRIYDSPTGSDLYRIKGPQGTTYHRQHYRSPLRKDVACDDARP
jgi:hypothetical protein